MSKNKKYTVRLANKGQINSNLHYGPYVRDWWISNLKIANNSVLNLPFRLLYEFGFDLIEGENIVEAVKGLSGTSLAEIKINRDDRSSGSEAENIELFARFICAKELSYIGLWKNFSSAEFSASLIRPKPIVSAYTEPISNWTMPIPTIKDML
ncbi:31693_t:CDS:2 [Racocetra persica]|uniref:31693_t:CDS:1 n=1 Tax=Racocetra persica TaxID=160502 RepID=A0ACA9Q0I9_9GLOM|nr:31693_t:CDS:2 [Racocetra persica]